MADAKVLIADDSMVMRLKIKNTLTKDGFEIIGQAKNGTEAFEKYKELKPDLVTMDIVMPQETGLDALKKIIDYDPEAKVIVVSGLHQTNLLREALEVGAYEYVIKPFSDEDLIEAVRKTTS